MKGKSFKGWWCWRWCWGDVRVVLGGVGSGGAVLLWCWVFLLRLGLLLLFQGSVFMVAVVVFVVTWNTATTIKSTDSLPQ